MPPAAEFISTDPTTGQVLKRFPTLGEDAVEVMIGRASSGFSTWRRWRIPQRAEHLLTVAYLLDQEAPKLAALMSRELGKPFAEGVGEAKKCAWVCRYYADNAPTMLADLLASSDGKAANIRFDPLGPILGIMPWNFPLWQVFRFAAPTLMAGNVVLIKHAPNVPQCAEAIATLMRRAGFPRGVYQDLRTDLAATARVIADRRVRGVSLTGSTRAGRQVAAIAGEHLKPCVLELGGNDPFIIMPSADLDAAVAAGIRSRMLNNGQSCIAAKRFIVHRDVAAAVEARMKVAIASLSVGDPMNESVDIGPMATRPLRDQLAAQVDRTIAAGATIAARGATIQGEGAFYPPTLLTGIPQGTPAYDDELFGPVASLFVVDDLAGAIALANDSIYGLGASIWTTEEAEAQAFIDDLQVGCVFVNGMVKSDPRLPFGGIKDSGIGRELGAHGIRAFTNIKTIWHG